MTISKNRPQPFPWQPLALCIAIGGVFAQMSYLRRFLIALCWGNGSVDILPTGIRNHEFSCKPTGPHKRYRTVMSVTPLPSGVHVAPKPAARSICSLPGRNRFFWVKSPKAPTLFDAFTSYVLDRFTDEYQASMAEAEFYARIQRAMRGQLVPVEHVKPMHEAPGVFEIRWNWYDYANGKKQYIGARLFHMEKVMERWIIAAYLMCKKSDTDDLSTYFKQTGGAKAAKRVVEESEPDRANAWEEYQSDEFTLA